MVQFTQFQYLSTLPGGVARRDPVRWSDSPSVMEFGAVGDGVANDTGAIQTAVNYCCRNGLVLRFPSPKPVYLINNRITIPTGTAASFATTTTSAVSQVSQMWALVGEGGRVAIQQQTDGQPIFYMAGLVAGDRFVNWRIENFRFQWTNNQTNPGQGNQYHVNGIEFDSPTATGVDVQFNDFIIRNIETVNGCRGIGINALVQAKAAANGLAVWGGVIEKVWHDSNCSGGPIFLVNSPETQDNLRIDHVYHRRGLSNEESVLVGNCDGLDISNVHVAFGSGSCVYISNSRNVTMRNLHISSATFNNAVSTATTSTALVTLHGSTVQALGTSLESNTLNLGVSGVQNVFAGDTASMLTLDGMQETGTAVTTGFLQYWSNVSTSQCQVRSVSDIATAVFRIGAATEDFSSLTYANMRVLQFYKNTIAINMTNIPHDSPSGLIDEIVDSDRWITAIAMSLSAAVSSGTITVTVQKNGVTLDPTNLVLSLTTGLIYGTHFAIQCKNLNSPTYKLAPGDKIRVLFTTNSGFAGPTSARVNLLCADLG